MNEVLPSKKELRFFGILVLLLVVFIISREIVNFVAPEETIVEESIVTSDESIYSNQPTLDSIYNEILNLRMDYPNIVFSQVLLETGTLTSSLYKTNNNLFGMKVSGSRATTSTKIINGYKWYPHWRESLIDYALLQMAFYRVKSEEEYFQRLGSVYASDHNYVKKLKDIHNKLK